MFRYLFKNRNGGTIPIGYLIIFGAVLITALLLTKK